LRAPAPPLGFVPASARDDSHAWRIALTKLRANHRMSNSAASPGGGGGAPLRPPPPPPPPPLA
jgi:hypothetical protein